MKAEIICVGTELLLGDVVNTNAAFIAKGLAAIGINVYHQAVVGDNPKRLEKCLCDAFAENDIVITTGGLGPTYDDLTKETVAAHFGKKLVLDQQSLDEIKGFYNRTKRVMTDNNIKQAMMPEDCIILHNPNGTAPGCIIQEGDKVAVMMPGPPREMLPMFEHQVSPWLEQKFGGEGKLFSKTINFFGVGESALEARLHDMIVEMTNPTVAPYAKPCECQLRVTARAEDEQSAMALIDPVVEQIAEIYPDSIYGYNYQTINEAVVDVFTKKGLTLCTAESLTGGLIAQKLVEISGASAVLKGGIISYTNEVKHGVLGVSQQILDEKGAVSPECALEMARGARKLTGADIALSATGVAGPTGGTEQTPVGRVYIAAVSEKGEVVKELNLSRGRADDREMIRNYSASHAHNMALKMAKLFD